MRAGIVLAAVVSILLSGSAYADPTKQAHAEELFQQGLALMDAGDIAEACARFQQSYRAEHKLGTLLNLALCHEKLGKTASAWAEFTEAANVAAKRAELPRAEFAKEHAAALETKLSHLVVRGRHTRGALLTIDGLPIDLALAGTPLPFDPGSHRAVLSAPAHETWSKDLLVPPGPAEVALELPLLVPIAPPPASPSPSPQLSWRPPSPTLPPQAGGGSRRRSPVDTSPLAPVLTWTGFGLAGAGVLAGSITGAMSLSRTGDIEAACPIEPCHPTLSDDIDSANTLANIANASFAVAGAGLIAGIVGVAIDDDGEHVLQIVPAPTGAAARVRF